MSIFYRLVPLFIIFIFLLCFIACSNNSSPFRLDVFVEETTLLLGKTYDEISSNTKLQEKERESTLDQITYKAVNTGLSSENSCQELEFVFEGKKLTDVLCRTTFDVADKAVDKANELYKDKGISAGTGMYVWCINNRGLNIFVAPSIAHVAISNICPEGSIE